jgi:hypothetical protein
MSAPRRLTGGNKIIALFNLNFSAPWRWVINIMTRLLYPREGDPYSLNRRLDGPQSQLVRFGETKNLLFQLGFKPRTAQPLILVVICVYTLHVGTWKKAVLN